MNHTLKNEKNGKQEPNTHEGISKLEGEKNEKSSQNVKVREPLVSFSLLKFSIFHPFFSISIPISISKFPKISISISKSNF